MYIRICTCGKKKIYIYISDLCLTQLRMAPKHVVTAKLKVKQSERDTVKVVAEAGIFVGKGQCKGKGKDHYPDLGTGPSIKLEIDCPDSATDFEIKPGNHAGTSVTVDWVQGDNNEAMAVTVGKTQSEGFICVEIGDL